VGAFEEAVTNHYTLPAKMRNASRILRTAIIVLFLLAALSAGVLIAYRADAGSRQKQSL
jgi:hypothetical protein